MYGIFGGYVIGRLSEVVRRDMKISSSVIKRCANKSPM